MEQTQCPNCGGYMASTHEYIHRHSGKTRYIHDIHDFNRITKNYFVAGAGTFLLIIGVNYLSQLSPQINIFGIELANNPHSAFGWMLIILSIGISILQAIDEINRKILLGLSIALSGWISIRNFSAGIAVSVTIGIFLLFLGFSRLWSRSSSRWKTLYRCHLCGYNWAWEPGDPLPEIKEGPELRKLGQEKMKRDEEDRVRRDQEDRARRRRM